MLKIILCRGIQGSGKTAWAKQWVLVGFNNDDIRNMNPKELEYCNRVPDAVRPEYSLEFKDFLIPLQECIERDSKRPDPIGEEVKYKDILKV